MRSFFREREGPEASFALALLRLFPAFALCRIAVVLASIVRVTRCHAAPGETSEFLQSPKQIRLITGM